MTKKNKVIPLIQVIDGTNLTMRDLKKLESYMDELEEMTKIKCEMELRIHEINKKIRKEMSNDK